MLADIRDFYKLPGLDFFNNVCTTLQGLELLTAIQSLTMIANELLSDNEIVKDIVGKYIFGTEKVDYQKRMRKSFVESNICQIEDLDWTSDQE